MIQIGGKRITRKLSIFLSKSSYANIFSATDLTFAQWPVVKILPQTWGKLSISSWWPKVDFLSSPHCQLKQHAALVFSALIQNSNSAWMWGKVLITLFLNYFSTCFGPLSLSSLSTGTTALLFLYLETKLTWLDCCSFWAYMVTAWSESSSLKAQEHTGGSSIWIFFTIIVREAYSNRVDPSLLNNTENFAVSHAMPVFHPMAQNLL